MRREADTNQTEFAQEKFDRFVAGLGLDHFSAGELLVHTGDPPNCPPPRELWPNIAETARVLDEFRARHGQPVVVISTYRNTAYNALVGGVDNSQHLEFNAIDFTSEAGAPEHWASVLREMRASGRFEGAIGVYPSRNFVHLDTRGYNAGWRGS